MKDFVKICGLRSADMIEVAVDAGANAIGLVFARSPRSVSVPEAVQLKAALDGRAALIAVMRHPAQQFAMEVLDRVAPDWLQTDAGDYASISLPENTRALPVFRDNERPDLQTLPDLLLFEGGDSGTGETADWSMARGVAKSHTMVLAGGLSPENVLDAIREVGPAGVDVSSGVEVRRGEKDAGAIRAFVAAAREGFAEMGSRI
ncbi:MAG: phosphoribosylanthranilate isomerase [Pseudomonadota bacterium]